MNRINKILQFFKDNPHLTLIGFLLLSILIIVFFSRKEVSEKQDDTPVNEIYISTKDFTVNYMTNGDIIVQTRNPDMLDLDTIKRTLNLPKDANVILDIPGGISYLLETDPESDYENNPEVSISPELTYDVDLNLVGD